MRRVRKFKEKKLLLLLLYDFCLLLLLRKKEGRKVAKAKRKAYLLMNRASLLKGSIWEMGTENPISQRDTHGDAKERKEKQTNKFVTRNL